jgi:hypothetical protein
MHHGFVMVFASDSFVGHQTSQSMSASSDKAGKNAGQNRIHFKNNSLQTCDANGIDMIA